MGTKIRIDEAALVECIGLGYDGIASITDHDDSPEFRRAVWDAIQRARDEFGAELRFSRGRLTETENVLRRARTFARTSYRKMRRAMSVATVGAEMCNDDEKRAALERTAEKLDRRLAMDRLMSRVGPERAADAVAYVATQPRGKPSVG